MLVRTITSVIFTLVILPICLFSDTLVLPIAVAVFCVLSVWEMLGCVGTRKNPWVCVPAYLLAAVLPLIARLFENPYTFVALYAFCFFAYLTVLFAASMFSRGKMDVERLGMSFAGVFYALTAFNAMILLRDREFGLYFLLLTLFGPWVTDVFAYLTGRAFGKHKLIPEVSPKKTVEGSVGGAVFCVIFAVLYGVLVGRFAPDVSHADILSFVVAGIVIGCVSQVGDLILSNIKRKYGIKDYGFLLPGHGGILDRFDSVIGVMPIMLILAEFPQVFSFFS